MFTSRSIGMILLALLLFFVAGFTQVGWVRIVDAVLWGMLGLSLLLQWLSTTWTDVKRRIKTVQTSRFGVGPMEGDDVSVDMEVVNQRFWPKFFVSAIFTARFTVHDSSTKRFFIANIAGRGTVDITTELKCTRRGSHDFGPVTIESQVPFGLFRRRKRVAAPLSLLVYPHFHEIERLSALQAARGMSARPQRSRSGFEIIGSRPFQPGDPLKHVHWRNTARLRQPVVKELEDQSDRAVAIVFGSETNFGVGNESTLEYAVKFAATIGAHSLNSGETVQLVAGEAMSDWYSIEPYLRELALLKTTSDASLAEQLDRLQPQVGAVVIVSAADLQGIHALASQGRQRDGLVSIVLEGFGALEDEVSSAGQLRAAGIPTITCRRGEIEAAFEALQQPVNAVAAGA
jgi:uncharacterized protein (DUF58 family)